MSIEIIYIFHNCFGVHLGPKRILLFDYPDAAHRPPDTEDIVRAAIAGKNVTVFISHSHADHFDPHLVKITAHAAHASYVVSDDVAELFPDALPDDRLLVPEPGVTARLDDLRIEAMDSNDMGFAYLITAECGDLKAVIYHGGDLADWSWPSLTGLQRAYTSRFFTSALERLASRRIDVAFSNMDARLAGFAGALEFVSTVQPRMFVPMHAFGRLEALEGLRNAMGHTPTKIFCTNSLEIERSWIRRDDHPDRLAAPCYWGCFRQQAARPLVCAASERAASPQDPPLSTPQHGAAELLIFYSTDPSVP